MTCSKSFPLSPDRAIDVSGPLDRAPGLVGGVDASRGHDDRSQGGPALTPRGAAEEAHRRPARARSETVRRYLEAAATPCRRHDGISDEAVRQVIVALDPDGSRWRGGGSARCVGDRAVARRRPPPHHDAQAACAAGVDRVDSQRQLCSVASMTASTTSCHASNSSRVGGSS